MQTVKNTKRGFGPLAIIVVIALAAVLGGGTYYSVKHSAKVNVEPTPTPEISPTPTETASSTLSHKTLKSLLSLGGNLTCTVKQSTGNTTSEGTVYISGSNMRGDFTTKSSSSAAIDSHMIRKAETIYVWSSAMANQGITMKMGDVSGASASANAKAGVDLEGDVESNCSSWTPDDSKFTLPSIKFMDVSAMMQGVIKANSNTGVDVKAKVKAGSEY